ncbi:MAG: hypothetical protein M3Q95_03835 [Bacteroidota bacterium]|nr:hypothetical protein [Bacteroidota bacterium]
MKRLLPLFFVFLTTVVFGQTNPFEYEEEKPPLMKNEFTFGLNLHTSGWGVNVRRSKNITGYKKRVFEAELVNMKHPKEIRSVNPYFDNAKSFFYGKMNTMTVLRAAVGKQNVLFSKAEKGGVEVRLHYTGGLSLGILKPVYLNILYPTGIDREYEVVVEKYDPQSHYVDNIYGRAPFTQGLGEIKPYPGAYGKLGLTFEYGTHSEDIKSIETGITIDAYAKEVPIMALTENKQFFINFYINLLYGRKW